ncbi:hypothetical protein [Rhodococcus baikonurensis]|uniref:Uncharacterized protein n=1 Tax=Rhodococcus baikonurensis TaxID=172041 RepID=A0ABV5XRU7_9NOCA
MTDGYAHLRGIGTLPTSMFATIRAMEKMAAPISTMTQHFAAIEKMTAPAIAITSQLAAIEKMTAPGLEVAARSAQISETFRQVERFADNSGRFQAAVPTFRSPMADLVVDSYRLVEPGRLFPSPRLFEQLRLFETPTFNPLSALDIAANRALEWAPLLDENSNTKPIPGLDALLAGKRNKLASARLTGAYIQLLLYARDRVGKSPGKIVASSPQVTRGPDTRSSTFKSTAGLASV